jgi:hypothetical protein
MVIPVVLYCQQNERNGNNFFSSSFHGMFVVFLTRVVTFCSDRIVMHKCLVFPVVFASNVDATMRPVVGVHLAVVCD